MRKLWFSIISNLINKVGFSHKLSDILLKERKGVANMRERINHKDFFKKDSVANEFWEEYKLRGFALNPENDGSFQEDIRNLRIRKKNSDTYEITVDDDYKFNIVSASLFMRTVSEIEGLVKYKLFK